MPATDQPESRLCNPNNKRGDDMKLLIVFVSVGVFTTVGLAADKSLTWPRFRGPNGSGVADGQKPPVEFGPDKNLKWKVSAPSGLSSPIVSGDKLVITAFDDGKLYTIAYNRADGKEAWRVEAPTKQIEAYHKTEGSPASSTPATDGERIVSYFGSCGLFCYDLSGKKVVAAGHAGMLADGLKSGAEKWFLNGMPSGCCSSPVTADGTRISDSGCTSGSDAKDEQAPSLALIKTLSMESNVGALSREE